MNRKFLALWVVMIVGAAVGMPEAFADICAQADCPATVSDPTVAAWGTQGYWFMGDVIHMLTLTNFNVLAPLIYVLAAASGLMMMAMGQPPKNYLWFMFGPALYNFFLAPDVPVKGVGFSFAGKEQDMKQVWEKSLVGLANMNSVLRTDTQVYKDKAPSKAINLPYPFVWFDEVISAQMQALSSWVGVDVKIGAQLTGNTGGNIHQIPQVAGSDFDTKTSAWYFLAEQKWSIVENVTAATFQNANLRDLLIEFLASECGDELAVALNKAAYANAAYARKDIPNSVYGKTYCNKFDDEDLISRLYAISIPTPDAYVKLAKNPDSLPNKLIGGDAEKVARSNLRFFEKKLERMPVPYNAEKAHTDPNWQNLTSLSSADGRSRKCMDLLHTLVQGMRWEAGHAYNQIVRQSIDNGIPYEYIPYDFTYGWDFGDKSLSFKDQEQYLIHLIMLHIFRNEMVLAPTGTDTRWTASEKALDYSKAYQRNIGSKNKAGELATWTKLMPYVQGAVLYLITAAYPFCVVVMVVPGWHKVLATWAGFFTWVKSWDFGFAFVNSLERSVWAIIGNDEQQQTLNRYIYRHIHEGATMADEDAVYGCSAASSEYLGGVNLLGCEPAEGTGFSALIGGALGFIDDNAGKACMVPQLRSVPHDYPYATSMALWDEMMILAPYLDLDLKNSYYIYLMSALYFAVPVVTGQIFLGAKAGAAQLLSGFNSAAQGSGEKAGAGFSNEVQARAKQAESVIGQISSAKAVRAPGADGQSLGSKVLSANNQAADAQFSSAANNTRGTMLGQESAAASSNVEQAKQNIQVDGAAGRFGQSQLGRNLPKDGAGTSASPLSGTGASATGNTPGGTSKPQSGNKGGVADNPFQPNKGWKGVAEDGNLSELMKQQAEAGITADGNETQAAIRQAQATNALQGLGIQGEQARLQNLGQRSDAQANFAAAQGRYDGVRNWANEVNNRVGGLGILGGSIAPPPKPTDTMGLAMNGNLGEGNRSKANYFGDNGGYAQNVSRAQKDVATNNNQGWSIGFAGRDNRTETQSARTNVPLVASSSGSTSGGKTGNF